MLSLNSSNDPLISLIELESSSSNLITCGLALFTALVSSSTLSMTLLSMLFFNKFTLISNLSARLAISLRL